MKYIFSFVFILTILQTATSASWYLAPRDQAALFLTGIESTFRSYSQFEAKKERCLREAPSVTSYLCQLVENVALPPQVLPAALDNFLQKETNLLLLGERHFDVFPKELLTNWLKELKERYGFRALGLEMINSSNQNIVDDYLADRVTEKDFQAIFERDWNYESTPYFTLIREAKRLGFSIIALDEREEIINHDLSESLKLRDLHWAKVILEYFKDNQESKMVVLSGKLHAFESFKNDSIKTVIELVSEQSNFSIKGQSALVFEGRASFFHKEIINKYFPLTEQYLYHGAELSPFTSALIYQK